MVRRISLLETYRRIHPLSLPGWKTGVQTTPRSFQSGDDKMERRRKSIGTDYARSNVVVIRQVPCQTLLIETSVSAYSPPSFVLSMRKIKRAASSPHPRRELCACVRVIIESHRNRIIHGNRNAKRSVEPSSFSRSIPRWILFSLLIFLCGIKMGREKKSKKRRVSSFLLLFVKW